MKSPLACSHVLWALCLIVALHWEPCHMQQTTPPTSRSSVMRWSRQYTTAAPAPARDCEYKELMTSLHDRVSILATLDEDQRNRLENIDKKIVQFEASNLARLESLNAQQMDFLKRLDSMELVQRMVKHQLDEFKGESTVLPEQQLLKAIAADLDNELNSTRATRQVLNPAAGGSSAPDDSRKLDALATLLASTRVAIGELQTQLQSNLTKLTQTTSNLQRRLNNIQRRQQTGGGAYGQSYQPPQPNYYATANLPQQLVTSCANGVSSTNGVLKLQLTATSEPFYVYCDDEPFGGGWTLIQHRYNGDENFQRDWLEYKTGFGNLAGEFFIGLEKLHALTASAVHELLIMLEDFDGLKRYARYNLFAIGSEQESYALNLLGSYEGDAGDAMTYHAGSKFSTFDNDNDGCVDCNCAQAHMGAWWYNWCEMSNLNGKYFEQNEQVATYTGMYWQHFRGPSYSLKSSKMLIRPVGAEPETRRR